MEIDKLVPIKLFFEEQVFLQQCPEYADDPDFPALSDAERFWLGMLDAITHDENWRDGRHLGDCTKFPGTCCRCLVEKEREETERFVTLCDEIDRKSAET